jgi:hypothetical protein
MDEVLRCLVYVNVKNSKNTRKGEAKLCYTAFIKNKCKCENCKKFNYLKSKKYKEDNLEKMRQHQKEYNKKNYKKAREYQAKHRSTEKYKIKRKKYLDEYNSKNIEKIRQLWRDKDRRRRANKKKNGFERYTENQVLKLYGTNCYLCSIPIDLNATRLIGKPGWQYGLHIEHVIDLALGGPDTLKNVRPSHAICNLKKKPKEMV